MQAANRVAKNTIFLYAKMGITMFLSLYTTRLLLLALGVKDFGLFTVVGGAIAMLGFLNGSMAAATQRFMSFAQGTGDPSRIKKIFNMSILLHLTIALLIFVVLEIAGYFFFNGILNIEPSREQTAKYIYQFMIVSTLFTVISVPYDALLNAHENMLFYSVLGIIESVLKLSIALYITYIAADRLLYYGALMATLSIAILIINRIYCHWKYPETKISLKANFDKPLLKEISKFAGLSLMSSATGMVAGYGSGIILNSFFGTIVNAANGVSGQLNGQLLAFSNNMQKALNPLITKSEGGGNRELMIKASLSGSKLSFLIFAFFSIPLLIDAPYILKIWLKEIPEWAILFSRLTIVFTLIEQMTVTLGTAISAVGNIKKINIYTSLLSIFGVFSIYIAFKLGGKPYFLPILSICVVVISFFIKLYFAKKMCGISYISYLNHVFLRIIPIFGITVTVSLVPYIFMQPSFTRLLSICTLSSIVFMISCLLFAFTDEEKRFIYNLKESVLKRILK